MREGRAALRTKEKAGVKLVRLNRAAFVVLEPVSNTLFDRGLICTYNSQLWHGVIIPGKDNRGYRADISSAEHTLT